MSKPLMLAAVLAGLPLALSAAPASAQPGGSYRQSCEDIRYSGGQLTATCGGLGGGARTTTINASQCRGDIGNTNGVLSCAGATATNVRLEPNRTVNPGRGGGYDPNARRSSFDGSYRRTCQNVSTSGSRLTASCDTGRGWRRTSTLDASRCRGDISNNGGVLACDGATAADVRSDNLDGRNRDRATGYDPRYVPGYDDRRGGYDPRYDDRRGGYDPRGDDRRGGYDPRYDDRRGGYDPRYDDRRGGYAGLTLYSERGFRGQAFDVRGDERNLTDRGWNDRARSLRVNGGRWRVCVHVDYVNCQVIYGDIDDLAKLRLSDTISSVSRID